MKLRNASVLSLVLCLALMMTVALVLALNPRSTSAMHLHEAPQGGVADECRRAASPDLSSMPKASLEHTIAITFTPAYTVCLPCGMRNYTPGAIGFGYGVQAYENGDAQANIGHIQTMGLGWVKLSMRWDTVEPTQGNYDWTLWDSVLADYSDARIKVLLTISDAPDWARPVDDDKNVEGLPEDPATYAAFVARVLQRYAGQVEAIEIWDEQNLFYAVGGAGRVDPATYVQLLQQAYLAIKAVDPTITVVSGGLTPAGAPLPMAMDDIEYLEAMYSYGAEECLDAVGAHPSGFNVAPWIASDQEACDFVTQQGSTFRGPCNKLHHSWYFLGTMQGYRDVMVANGDEAKKILVTEFGWAVSDNPPPAYQFAYDNTYQEQAEWTVWAFQWGKDAGWVAPMMLFNLDYGLVAPGSEISYWSLLTPTGPVPAYTAIQTMPK
jgi:hypothetical protein